MAGGGELIVTIPIRLVLYITYIVPIISLPQPPLLAIDLTNCRLEKILCLNMQIFFLVIIP
jgi:hypothetical protein